MSARCRLWCCVSSRSLENPLDTPVGERERCGCVKGQWDLPAISTTAVPHAVTEVSSSLLPDMRLDITDRHRRGTATWHTPTTSQQPHFTPRRQQKCEVPMQVLTGEMTVVQ